MLPKTTASAFLIRAKEKAFLTETETIAYLTKMGMDGTIGRSVSTLSLSLCVSSSWYMNSRVSTVPFRH